MAGSAAAAAAAPDAPAAEGGGEAPQAAAAPPPEVDAARRVELAATIKTETKWLDDKKAARKGRGCRPTEQEGRRRGTSHKDALFNAQQELAGNRARAVAQRRATNADVRAQAARFGSRTVVHRRAGGGVGGAAAAAADDDDDEQGAEPPDVADDPESAKVMFYSIAAVQRRWNKEVVARLKKVAGKPDPLADRDTPLFPVPGPGRRPEFVGACDAYVFAPHRTNPGYVTDRLCCCCCCAQGRRRRPKVYDDVAALNELKQRGIYTVQRQQRQTVPPPAGPALDFELDDLSAAAAVAASVGGSAANLAGSHVAPFAGPVQVVSLAAAAAMPPPAAPAAAAPAAEANVGGQMEMEDDGVGGGGAAAAAAAPAAGAAADELQRKRDAAAARPKAAGQAGGASCEHGEKQCQTENARRA